MKILSNFTEHTSAEEIINELDNYIPCLDEDRQFIRKYRNDFIYHYNNNFYNLALFSFHYIYMFIISTSMVKYYSFNKNEVINQSGHNHDLNIELYAYFGKESEKNAIKSVQRNLLQKEIKQLHILNVTTRDNIAHSNGIKIILSEIIQYINNCFEVLENIQPISLSKCFKRSEIKEKWNKVNYDILDAILTNNQSSLEELIINFLIDYHLSYKDILFFDAITTKLNAIKFLRQFLIMDNEGYSISYNEELDLHRSIFESFISKYQSAYSTDDENIISKEEIITFLKELDNSKNNYIAYNVYDKIIEISQYWIPFGVQRIKENINV